MTKRLKLPFWATILTGAGLCVLVGLGSWQIQRLAWKTDLLAQIDQAYESEAPRISTLDRDLHLTRGQITGRFLQKPNILISLRTHDGTPGYHILSAFKTNGGQTLLINRGWVDLDTADTKIPRGVQTLTGLFKTAEKPNFLVPQNTPETNTWYRIDLPQIAEKLGIDALAPVLLYTEDQTAEKIIPVGTKPAPNNNHLQYAIFWFTMAGVLFIIYVLRFIRRKT